MYVCMYESIYVSKYVCMCVFLCMYAYRRLFECVCVRLRLMNKCRVINLCCLCFQTENSMSETDHRHSYPVHEAKQQTEDTIQLSNSLVRLIHVLNMIKAREGGGRGVSPKPSLKRVTSKRGPASIVSSAESGMGNCTLMILVYTSNQFTTFVRCHCIE